MISVRVAKASDAEPVATMFLACWRSSYSAVMPAALVASMNEERALQMWSDALAKPELSILVATDDSEPQTVLGLVGFRSESDGSGYLSSLYVSPEAQGSGLGGRLLREAEAALRSEGHARATLWVFEANHPSIRFYERHGWRLDGRETTLAEWGEPQLGMSKDLS